MKQTIMIKAWAKVRKMKAYGWTGSTSMMLSIALKEAWAEVKSANANIRAESNGVILSAQTTNIEAEMTKRNKRAIPTYSKEVLKATVDSEGNVTLDYVKGSYSGDYGDLKQTVYYSIKAGFVDGEPVNMDLSKASSISGKSTYSVREAAKQAGMTWNGKANAYLRKNHILNTNTKLTRSELEKMSDTQLNRVTTATVMKEFLAMGYTFIEATNRMKKFDASKGTRQQKIETIEKFNK